MGQLICASLSHTHYWYEVGMLKVPVVMLLLLLLVLSFSVLVANPKKLLYTVANPARGLLSREKRTEEKSLARLPQPLPFGS